MASGDFKITEGSEIVFRKLTGTIKITLDGLGLFGRVSDPCDLTTVGDATGPGLYRWGVSTRLTGTEKIGAEMRLWLAFSDKTNDFNISQVDAATNPETTILGAHYLGSVVCNSNAGAPSFTAFGRVMIPVPQVQLIVWNATTIATAGGNNSTFFTLVPLVYSKVA